MAHCFLFTSNDYLSAESAAVARAQNLVSSSHDLLLATNEIFEPDSKKKGNAGLTVNAARAICRESLGVPIGERKVFVFPHADLMTLNAQNALLKLFEEPPANVCFFLATSKPSSLLPTIRSRCEQVFVGNCKRELPAIFNKLQALSHIEKPSDMHRIIAFCVEHKDEKNEILDSLEEIFRQTLLRQTHRQHSVSSTKPLETKGIFSDGKQLQNNAKSDMLKKIAVARMQVAANCNWNAIVWRVFQ